jgi:hypothetical protein
MFLRRLLCTGLSSITAENGTVIMSLLLDHKNSCAAVATHDFRAGAEPLMIVFEEIAAKHAHTPSARLIAMSLQSTVGQRR